MEIGDRVRIGNQTSYRAEPILAPFEYAVSRGFDAFEWFPDRRPNGRGWRAADLDSARRAEIRRIAEDRGMTLSVHAPLPSDPARPEGVEDGFRLAVDLGARLLNVHFTRTVPPDAYAESVAPLARRCAEVGLILAIENNPPDGPEVFDRLFREDFGWPPGVVGMCLDIGHANLFPETRGDFPAYLDRLGPHVPIVHVHAHENLGDRDSHLTLFSGPLGADPSRLVRLVAGLRSRGFRGSVVLEQWPDPPSLLDRARDGLLGLFSAPADRIDCPGRTGPDGIESPPKGAACHGDR